MSVRNVQPAELSNIPTISLDEARKRGLNVAKTCTCAVPMKNGLGGYTIRGCNKGEHCGQSGFGTARMGGFGPKSAEPGTSGSGTENVPYYHYDIGSSTEVEGFMPCYIFMQTMMDKYESQRKTGDILEVLGREGECSITILETLPSDGNGNRPGSQTSMVETSKVITVPKFRVTDGKSVRMEYALKIRQNRDRTEALQNRTRMAPVMSQDGGDVELDGAAVDNVLDVPADQLDDGSAEEVVGVLEGVEAMQIPPSGRKVKGPRG
jgi:hypothetical protein